MSNELFAEEQDDVWTDKEAYDWLRKAGFHLKVAKQRDWRDVTPLHAAATTGHQAMVNWLIGGGADVRAKDCYGLTPTHRAAKAGCLDILEYLLQNGAEGDVHTVDRRGKTPQALACEGGHSNVSFYLHDHGATNNGQRVYIEQWIAARTPVNCFDD